MYKNEFEGKKAVVFDLDGTLVETGDYWRRAFSKVAREVGGLWYYPSSGSGVPMVEKWASQIDSQPGKYKDKFKAEELAVRTGQVFIELLDEYLEVKDGFMDLRFELSELKGVKIVLASNTDKFVVDAVLKHLDLDWAFDLIITGSDVKKHKPDPEMYKTVSKKLGLKPKEILVFEDSVVGVQAAVKAGMDVFVIWNGETDQSLYPKKKVLEFTDDFVGFAGNLDRTTQDIFEQVRELLSDKKRFRVKLPDNN